MQCFSTLCEKIVVGKLITSAALMCVFCQVPTTHEYLSSIADTPIPNIDFDFQFADDMVYGICTECKKICEYCEYECIEAGVMNTEPTQFICSHCQSNMTYKECPNCKVMTQKIIGCNHIRCPCGYHWCFDCGEYMSPDEDMIYAHLRRVHGGINTDDDNNVFVRLFDFDREDYYLLDRNMFDERYYKRNYYDAEARRVDEEQRRASDESLMVLVGIFIMCIMYPIFYTKYIVALLPINKPELLINLYVFAVTCASLITIIVMYRFIRAQLNVNFSMTSMYMTNMYMILVGLLSAIFQLIGDSVLTESSQLSRGQITSTLSWIIGFAWIEPFILWLFVLLIIIFWWKSS